MVNDPDCSAELRQAIASAVGLENLAEAQQSSGGEDFAWYLEHVSGALGRLGVWDGTNDPRELHQPHFDLDERALLHGVRTFVAVARGDEHV